MNETITTSRRSYIKGVGAVGVGGALAGCLGGTGDGGEPITMGAILPRSAEGIIGQIGAQHTAAVRQAIQDVNRAGGIHGRPVELAVEDSGASGEQAMEALDRMRSDGALGFVGAVLSSVSVSLAERVGEEPIMQVSPASTSPRLADMGYADGQKFFGRTVPNDILQAYVMAKILDDSRYIDAAETAIIHVDDAFGAGLAAEIQKAIDGTVSDTIAFEEGAEDFTEVIESAVADEPDGVALVSVPGAATQKIVEQRNQVEHDAEWVASAGLLPANPPSFFDGLYGGSLASAQTTAAAKLTQKLGQFDGLVPFTQQAYDAAFLQALALERAEAVSSEAIASNLQAVSGGQGHTVTVGEFERAKKLLANGREVNYRGASGDVDLQSAIEPLSEYLVQHVSEGAVNDVELLKTSFFKAAMEGSA